MKNNGWLVVAGMFVFALVLAACGSGDGTSGGKDEATRSHDGGVVNPTGPSGVHINGVCGDGICTLEYYDEDCYRCPQDCACATNQTCWNTQDYPGVHDQNYRADMGFMGFCGSSNPLIGKLPGHWVAVEPPNADPSDVTVDPSDPDCHDGLMAGGYNPNPNPNDPGDACIGGFQGAIYLVLHGSSLRIVFPDISVSSEGQVLNDGARVEYTETYRGDEYHYIYERQ